jgi:hypothetical protein
MKRLSFIIISGLLLTLLIIAPVSAKQPFVEVFNEHYTNADVVDCTIFLDEDGVPYDFKIQDELFIDTRWTTFFDKYNKPTRLTVHANGVDNLYNPNNPEYKLSDSFNNIFFDWNFTGTSEPEGTITGLWWHITLPGYGNVLFDAGQGTLTPTEGYKPLVGHHELDEVLCAALAPTPAVQATGTASEPHIRLFLPAVIGSTPQ